MTELTISCEDCADTFTYSRVGNATPRRFCDSCRKSRKSMSAANASTHRNLLGLTLRDAYLQKQYGITEAQYDELSDIQQGVCALCGRVEHHKGGRLKVDHAHDETAVVRGLLCNSCNTALGKIEKNIGLDRLVEYVRGEGDFKELRRFPKFRIPHPGYARGAKKRESTRKKFSS